MSTATLDEVRRRGPVDLTARWFVSAQARVARWFWAIAVVVSVLAITVYALVADQVTTSVVAFGRQAVMWVPFSIFIGLTAVYLPVHVASGLTRRSLSRGSLTGALATALLYGGGYAVLLVAERATYAALGWHWQIAEGVSTNVGSSVAYLAAFLVANAATLVIAYVSGLVVSAVYLRGGGWWGTLTLPLTVGPLLVLSSLLGWGTGLFGGVRGLLLGSVLALVVAAVLALVYDLLVRGARVPTRR
jgi:hypothetical protein